MAMKRVLITGASQGIGAAIARELQPDYQLYLCARHPHELAQELGAVAIQADLLQTIPELPPVDILINNAGVASSAPLTRLSLEEWNRIFQLNLTATMLITQRCLPAMLEQGWGRIINVASVAGLTGARYISAYSASKHAVIGLTRSLADEVALKGITVNALCPGFVDTPMTRHSLENIQATTGRSADQAMQALTSHSPQQRLIEPEEIAYAARFLCHERARGINGQCLVIDGGGLRA